MLWKNVDILALQETKIDDHVVDSARGNLCGFRLVDATDQRLYGTATYVRQDINDVSVIHKDCVDLFLHLDVSKCT